MVTGVVKGEGLRGRPVLRGAITGQWRSVVPASVLAMVHQACEALVPVLIGVAVDRAVGRQDPAALFEVLAGFVALFAVLTASMRGGGRLVRRATQGAGHTLRVRIAERALHPRGVDRDAVATGEVFSVATSDAQRVGMVNAAVWTAAGAAAALVVGAVLLLRTSTPLGLVVLIGLIPVFALTSGFAAPLDRRSGVEQATAARAAATATDLLSGLRTLAGLGAETTAAVRYARMSAEAREAGSRAAGLLAARSGVVTAVTGVFLTVVAVSGGALALNGSISIGEFVAALGLTQFLLGPFNRIMLVGAQVARARASARRVAQVLDAPYAVGPGVGPRDPGPATLELVGLRTGSGPVLDLRVDAGETVGLVLAAPGAAEALLAVLAREREPDSGSIVLGGVRLDELEPVTVRRSLHVARHDAPLFTGTLGGIVAFGAADDGAATRARTAADVDQVARSLPDGLGTSVTERGRSLSGGQRQRVALARALAADADVLVLHDPTTAVDAVTEATVAGRVRELRRDRTTLIVTSSPALLAVADRVLLVDTDGAVESGVHAALGESPRYRELVLS